MLGQPAHYIEPFCGSCAVLLARPTYIPGEHTETVNDADGHIANVWRSLQAAPDDVARWCDWPVNHADLMARKKRLNEAAPQLLASLASDDGYYDAKLAGYYIWAASCWIGSGLVCPSQRPHLSDAGNGVHKASVAGQRPHIGGSEEVADIRAPYNTGIYTWLRRLSERLRNVRVVCGDWSRVCGENWQANLGTVGIFLDPPYSEKANRDMGIYAVDSASVAHDVREWCIERGARSEYRIVLAGYYEEHDTLLSHGWTVHQWSAKGGYANTGDARGKENRHKEALFCSPHCIQTKLF